MSFGSVSVFYHHKTFKQMTIYGGVFFFSSQGEGRPPSEAHVGTDSQPIKLHLSQINPGSQQFPLKK